MADQYASEAEASRDSHDLSLSPYDVTRDSLVNNMLLSLDQFSLEQKAARAGGPHDSPPPLTTYGDAARTWIHDAINTTSAIKSSKPAARSTNARHHFPEYKSGLDAAAAAAPAPSAAAAAAEHDDDDDDENDARDNRDDRVNRHDRQDDHHDGPNDNDSASLSVPRPRRSDTATGSSLRFLGRDAPSAAGTARATQSRGRDVADNNVGSTPSPFDDAPETLDWASRRPFRRSVSLDQLYRRQGLHEHFPETLLSPLQTGRPPFPASIDDAYDIDRSERDDDDDDDDSSDYGAAPTPSVPSRSRRSPSDFHNPFPPLERPEFPPRTRERSTSRSVKSSSGRSRRAVRLRSVAPAMPPCDLDAAPAPSVSYGKSKAEQAAFSSTPKTPPQPRERQGFFRRVFGSRSNASSSIAPDPQQQPQQLQQLQPQQQQLLLHHHHQQPAPRCVSSTLHQVSAGSRSMAVASPRDVSTSYSGHPSLQKKPSSFFRRYIMGTAEEPPPLPTEVPPLPLAGGGGGGADADPSAKSPVSSLRNVMNPYLSGRSEMAAAAAENGACSSAERANNTSDYSIDGGDKREFKRDFSPDYEPSPNAKIRAVTSDSDRDPTWDLESPTSHRPPRYSDKASKKRSDSFLSLGSGSEYGELSPRSLGGQLMRAVGREHDGNSAADAAGLSALAIAGRDYSATIRPSKRHTYQMMMMMDSASASADADDDPATRLKLFIPGERCTSFASDSTETDYKTAPSQPASVRIEVTSNLSPRGVNSMDMPAAGPTTLDEPEIVVGDPTEEDRIKAHQIFDGNEDFLPKEKAAAWMGEEGSIRQRTLQAYMELFDFSDMSVVCALRSVCSRLILRAETQQVDRILVAFSHRWCECNPNHGFKSMDVIHTICYSIMLLNTDLHIADIEQKMTRSQFVKNTIGTILQTVLDSDPDAFERPSILPEKSMFLSSGEPVRPSTEPDRKTFRNSFRPTPRADNAHPEVYEECGPLVKVPFYGNMKAWEEQVELSLKLAYASIREECLPLFGAESEKPAASLSSQGSLSVMGMLKRSPSVLSKAPSESFMSTRGRATEAGRNSSSRWTSRNRTRAGLGRPGISSSRTSFDDASSIWSPALSSATWSRYSLGRTHASVSQDSLGSNLPRGDYQQSIGFANALSQAIYREDDPTNDGLTSVLSADIGPSAAMLEDESLELSGPPWVKEGRVVHKHHLDGVGKKAKDRNWSEVFAVVQKGHMVLFSFQTGKSTRQKSRGRNAAKLNGPVGGGNWQDNAVQLCSFNLRLTLASALPSPGYSRLRPFVWALSLPSGAVHLFQVGTPEIIQEFVDTANYWSARLSSHPLIGGISNMEYGWSDGVVSGPLVTAMNDSSAISIAGSDKTSRPGSSATMHARKTSVQSTILQTTSLDQGSSGALTLGSGKGKPPGDRIHISDWTPPTQSMRASSLPEAEQHNTLASYVKTLEEELQIHNQLRGPMLLAYSPRSTNAYKANANWERKSAYLLRETVKFRTYVDALAQATSRKREIYKERDMARRETSEEPADPEMEYSGDEDGDETLRPT